MREKAKVGIASDGRNMHYSVGAVIKKDGKFLLIDRKKPPQGFAGLAGHVDEKEEEEKAIVREVKEESGLAVRKLKLLAKEEIPWNTCSKGITVHYWFLYECEAEGKVRLNKKEAKLIGWFSAEDIRRLRLEPVWAYWFRKLGIISYSETGK